VNINDEAIETDYAPADQQKPKRRARSFSAARPEFVRMSFRFSRDAPFESVETRGMLSNEMSQPGRTGNAGVLRIVKAAQRAFASVDPTGHRSVVVSLRSRCCSAWSSLLRLPPPVSVGLRTIETGGDNLAQRQALSAFASDALRCKSPQIRLFGGDIREDVAARV